MGSTLEFNYPGCFEPITEMIGGGPFNLNLGEWTDDTSMALCLAEVYCKKRVRPSGPAREVRNVVGL